jgi:polysaccharide deacetylase family protein (PEP-CTERM system associated)
MQNILSFDIEEHFQVSGLAAAIKREDWDKFPSRVEANTVKILEILGRHDVKATFFVLGWIAQRFPQLIRRIAQDGHEIACHGLEHRLIYNMSLDEFRADVKSSLEIIENIIGSKILGFRAPSFSLSVNDIEKFEILAELGIAYDSSLFPMKHFRYGDATGIPLGPFDIKNGDRVLLREFPMTVVKFMGRRIPAGGGGYFRLYPDFLIRHNFRKVNAEGRPAIIYLHPWEFDPDQPRVSGAGRGNTFRHYYGLNKTENKLDKVLVSFRFGTFREFRQNG